MKKLLDRDISSASSLWDGLLLFFGFNIIHARLGCYKLGITKNTNMNVITNKQLRGLDKKLRERYTTGERTKKFIVGPDLKKDIYQKTSILQYINAYRGVRLNQGLPCRGQRTHTNAKTAKKLNIKRFLPDKFNKNKKAQKVDLRNQFKEQIEDKNLKIIFKKQFLKKNNEHNKLNGKYKKN